jgi:two-component system sensor histidine kinase KdpD
VENAAWIGLAVIVTASLIPLRGREGTAQITLIYLLVVLCASARRGRRLGLVLATSCFFAFNFFFVPPYGTLSVGEASDWFVLLAFLLTSVVAAQLLHRAQAEATAASARAMELERLATLGEEAIQAHRAEDAVVAIARVIREELGVDSCELFLLDPPSSSLRLIASATSTSAESFTREQAGDQSAATLVLSTDPRTHVQSLQVRHRQVGLLRLRSDDVIRPDLVRYPFAEALAYYAALGLERVRLTIEAEHAGALREADTLKNAVLAAVSHDLRTPLTTIKAIAQEIADSGDERAAVVEVEADRLNQYVSNLLDLSRLNAGALQVTRELVPIEDLLGAALQQLTGIRGGRDIRVEVPTDGPMLTACLDFGLTLRALGNLIENALRYSEATAVDVRAYRDEGRVHIAVADRGPGIPTADQARVFEPFQRGSISADGRGAGLGLSIARRALEAQGGTVTFTPRPGGGSVFTMSIPASDAV